MISKILTPFASALIIWARAQSLGTTASFSPPEKITAGGAKYQMSRTADRVMEVDASGTLHAVYWAGRTTTTPSTPSFVYYRNWNPVTGWGAQVDLDDSVVDGQHVGGRHPSLALSADGTATVVWHDYRNGTSAALWIDNVEIYADVRPPGGTFSSSDLRLTTTSALHAGDNSYAPKIARAPNGRLQLLWYDFNADQDVSDLYLKISNPAGQFNPSETLASTRLSTAPSRGGGPAFTVPDFAIDSTGARHIVWAGGQGSDVDLYYGELRPDGTQLVEQLLPFGLTSFFDPPHIAIGPDDTVWICFADTTTPNHENVILARRPAGQAGFDPPVALTQGPSRHYMPDLKIDHEGRAHIVWIDQRLGTHVYHALYDPAGGLMEDRPITTQSGPWLRPALTLDAADSAYVLFEENVNALVAGEIWFTTTARNNAVAPDAWAAYP